MGIPYSKQINAAFDQVTPLVAAGFEVLQTTKNISIVLAAIQVLTALLLALILLTLVALLLTVNPDLDVERRTIVTPVLKWFTCWLMPGCVAATRMSLVMGFIWSTLVILLFVGAWAFFSYSTNVEKPEPEDVPVSPGEQGNAGDGEGEKG